MSVSKMEMLTVVVPHARADALIERLMRLRCVDLTTAPCDTEGLHPMDCAAEYEAARTEAERIEAVLPLLHAHVQKKRTLFPKRARVRHADFRTDGRMDVALKVVEETEKLRDTKESLIESKNTLLTAMNAYRPYLGLKRPLDFEGTDSTVVLLGAFPARTSHTRIVQALADRAAIAEIVSEDATGVYVSMIIHHSEQEETLRAVEAIGYMPAEFPNRTGSARALYDRADKARAEVESKLSRIEKRLSALAERIFEVEVLADITRSDLLVKQHKMNMASTATCAVLTGWCPVNRKGAVQHLLDRMEVAYEFSPASEEDKPPVMLHNHALVRPFRGIMSAYIAPVYGGFDPTLLLGVLYCLVFGLMLADVGYGVLVAAAAFLLIRFCHMPRALADTLRVVGYGGVFAALIGILIGSYFGPLPALIFDEMPSLALLPRGAVRVITFLDPLLHPVAMLGITYLLGALHLLFCMVLCMITMIRANKTKEALLALVPHIVLLCGVTAFLFSWLVGLIATLCALIAIIVISVWGKKGAKNILRATLDGFRASARYACVFFTFHRTVWLAMAAAALGFLLQGAVSVPFMGLLLVLLAFMLSLLLGRGVDILLALSHAKGLPYADVLGRFYAEANPAFSPIMPAGRFAEDVSFAESNLL